MDGFPPEIYIHILGFLGAKDVISFCASDKSRRNFGRVHSLVLSRLVDCDGNIVAEKLGGLYVPDNEPVEKEREEMKAKFLVTPLGVPEGKLEFKGEYGSHCFWDIRKGMLHGSFRCEMETAYDYTLVEEGNYRRGKLHGKVVSFRDFEPKYRTITTWYKGQKRRVHQVSKEKVSLEEFRTFRKRKSREKYSVVARETFFKKDYSINCNGKGKKTWAHFEETEMNGKCIGSHSASWVFGDSWWVNIDEDGKITEHTFPGYACVYARCCEWHGKRLEDVASGIASLDYFRVFG